MKQQDMAETLYFIVKSGCTKKCLWDVMSDCHQYLYTDQKKQFKIWLNIQQEHRCNDSWKFKKKPIEYPDKNHKNEVKIN